MTEAFSHFERIARTAKKYGHSTTSENRGVHPFDERNIHPEIAYVSMKLFDDGHYSQATFEAFKYIENQVKTVSSFEDTGFSLMMNAFNEAGPKIRLTELNTTSEKDEQKGFRHMFAGAMSAIRNPRGHDNRVDPIDVCLDHLSVASVLLRALGGRVSP